MDLIALLTAFGLGSIVTTVVQTVLNRRTKIEDRNFEERKAAYVGLLEAYHRAAVEGSSEAGKEFAYWQMRCELVSPPKVRAAIQAIIATNENRAERVKAHEALKDELRADLKITRQP
jgi:hypothetical protein